jgi:hypothetical protein
MVLAKPADDRYPHRTTPGRAAALTAFETACSVAFVATEGGGFADIVIAAVFSAVVVAAGLRILWSAGPVLSDRVRWNLGFAGIGGAVLPGLVVSSRAFAGTPRVALVLGLSFTIAATVWWSSSPRRGGGWTQRYLIGPGRYALCDRCAMAGRRNQTCKYCGVGTPG